ncbi:unnamed protein product (macronuclear) [Paramecium tetraurelia]|uniref:Cyclic nucleotide-binding domain-containing protein n=1 Tax=Paramecium tetraurelia TaxID=5888 RepID=A0D2T2_PARTE|nr:uncharacterized protein GSPATT00012857001 [Paramecium tetraurelia]CAK77349.1 unnamed protein product [Paramecium tetraurelia]|eukprot:XP_001444746.1 hypothetical protein (macronuclear) [Paramecium tetraurelia strain d4-2]
MSAYEEPLSSPNMASSIVYMNDEFLNNFKMKQSQLTMLDKIKLSRDVSELSILSQDSDDFEAKQGFKNKVWKDRALNIIVLVARFVTYLLTNSDKFKLRYLDHRQFKVIGDQASDFNFYVTQKLIRGKSKKGSLVIYLIILRNQQRQKLNIFSSIIKPIKPDNSYKLYWDVLVFFILLINIIYIPLKISFEISVVDGANLLLDTLPQYVFVFEILLNFNVAYYSRGVLVLNRGQIFKHYLKGKFALDFIVLIPFMIGRSNVPYIEFVLLFRVSRVMYIFENIVETMNLRVNFASAVDIISLMSTFLFASHIIACIWHFIAIQEAAFEENTWIQRANLDEDNWKARYITSFYWACITTLTIGYGDIIPVTQYEKIFVIFVTLLSSIIFGYTISSIGSIFAQMSENKNYLRDRMTVIDSFLKKRGLNKDLQVKVKKFFEYFLKQERDQESECEKLMYHLSGSLNKEVKIDFYKNLLCASKLIRQNFSAQFIEKLCILVKEQSFVPEEIISVEGQKVDKIYFILKGEVEAYISNNKTIKIYSRNQAIDEKSFVSQHPALFSTRAIKFSKLAYITYDDLQDLLKYNQEDREHFYQVKHQIEFGGRVKMGGCELCHQNHDFIKCPFVFYTPNSLRLFKKNDHDEKQHRMYQMRSREERLHNNSLGQLRNLQSTAFNYCAYQGLLNEIGPNSEFITSNKFNFQQDSAYEDMEPSLTNSDNESEYKPIKSQNQLQIRRDSRRKVSDNNNKDNQSMKSKKKQTRISIQKVGQQNRNSGQIEREQGQQERKYKSSAKRATLILNQMKLEQSERADEDPLQTQFQQTIALTLQTQQQGQQTPQAYHSAQLVRTFDVDQVQLIEMDIAKIMASKECDVDTQKQMEFYDTRFNLDIVVGKLKKVNKKLPLKLKRKRLRKSFARSQSIKHISQTKS